MPSLFRARVRSVAALGLLLLPTFCSGQTLKAQRPGDAYYLYSGMWCGHFDLDPGRARVAVLAALATMQMPVYQEGLFTSGSFLDTKTVDNFETRLTIVPLGPGGPTQVCVRIGGFGTHRQVCARILDEIARHLEEARRAPPAPGVLFLPAPGGMSGPRPLIILRPSSTPPPALPPQPTPPRTGGTLPW